MAVTAPAVAGTETSETETDTEAQGNAQSVGCYFEVLVLIIHDNPSMKMNTKTQCEKGKIT